MFEKKNQKLAGLWLVGEMDNHVAIYGSKVAEGFSAFQRRSCICCRNLLNVQTEKRVLYSTDRGTNSLGELAPSAQGNEDTKSTNPGHF